MKCLQRIVTYMPSVSHTRIFIVIVTYMPPIHKTMQKIINDNKCIFKQSRIPRRSCGPHPSAIQMRESRSARSRPKVVSRLPCSGSMCSNKEWSAETGNVSRVIGGIDIARQEWMWNQWFPEIPRVWVSHISAWVYDLYSFN